MNLGRVTTDLENSPLKEIFVGREREFQAIKEDLVKGNSIIISGDYGAGKTFLALLIRQQLEIEGYYVPYFSTREYLETIISLNRKLQYDFPEYEVPDSQLNSQLEEQIRSKLMLIKTKRNFKGIVLFFDEFEVSSIKQSEIISFSNFFRQIAFSNEKIGIGLIVSKSALKNLRENIQNSLFLSFFNTYILSALNLSEINELLQRRFQKIDEQALKKIYNLSQGNTRSVLSLYNVISQDYNSSDLINEKMINEIALKTIKREVDEEIKKRLSKNIIKDLLDTNFIILVTLGFFFILLAIPSLGKDILGLFLGFFMIIIGLTKLLNSWRRI